MGRPFIFFLALLSVLIFAGDAYADTTTGLVAWWKLDEGTGATTIDSSGQANTGTLVNAPSWVNGRQGMALNFAQASNQAVTINDNPALRLNNNGTISAWINATSYGGNNFGRIIDKTTDTTGSNGYTLTINSAISGFQPNAGGCGVSVNNTVTLGQWIHVVWTINSGTFTVYVNGVSKASGSCANPVNVAHAISIGARSGATDRNFDGIIDDVRIYNRVLTAADIRALYLNDNRLRNATMKNVQFK